MSQYSDNQFSDSDNHSWGLLNQYIESGMRVLDVGCSSGNFGKVLVEGKQCIVDGIEPFHNDAVAAAKKLRHVYEMNVETDDLSRITDKYDVIMFADVIEHLVDPVTTLERIKPLLLPGGSVIYSIPNMAHISIRLGLLAGDFEHTETGLIDRTHLHYYTRRQIEITFNNAGYGIVDQQYTFVPYSEFIIKQRLEEAGLKATPAALKRLNTDIDIQAFQFVGRAQPSSAVKKTKAAQVLPHERDVNGTNQYIHGLNQTIADKDARLAELEDRLRDSEHEVRRLLAQEALLGHRIVRKLYQKASNLKARQ